MRRNRLTGPASKNSLVTANSKEGYMEGTVPWAGRGYPEDDKFTALFDAAVDALTKVHDMGTSQYCAGLIHAYALVTGDRTTSCGTR